MVTTLKVPDMHCDNCVLRITKALGALGLSFSVSLPDKTVTVDGDDGSVKSAINALDDLGFDVEGP